MFDAVVILGIQLMLNRIYAMNIVKSVLVIVLMGVIFASVLGHKPDNPFDAATELPFMGSGVVAMIFNAVAIVTSLGMRNIERKMYG
ncbi:hypothetical protein L3N51_00534 [Metallosphaera sp. J1]|uniref:hypothetical protein n=1 Tax=Metallosphaera javensis (ex Hofmann et al. 2022) TaxID=99938 RepID=UPI001EDFAECA|nr:hypothetical protein [Metallosphaera javensis (ex Hofmann et al. 2022)]MCG3108253.1 hypothetical protein [Metallosphaera javensis (ex Hofmann et al. 2022)]